GKESVASGIYDIVLSKEMAATLLATFSNIFSADAAQRGLSLLAGKEGTEIANELVTIVDDPFCEETFLRMSFDGEGVATYSKNVVAKGKLVTLLHNLATAHKAGVASTGNGRKASYAGSVSVMPYNFYLAKGGAGTCEDIFKETGKGIYVTSLNGLHAGADAVTGDFSIASEGFRIEDGKKSHAIKNFTISGNFYELLNKIALVGDDLEFLTPRANGCFGAPTVMIKQISVAGK
ncbi:MAG: TldD/PmbA family protein, partial [Lachnospiraceae bacterium]|nr:TldD/PmbA family protein [Lachnospiraceae bacterium]